MNNVYALVLALGLMTIPALGYTAEAPAVVADPVAAAAAEVPIEVGNKICPVSGEKIGGMGEVVKHEHNGKIYNMCCSMCAKDFNKDPDKYAKIADDEVKVEAPAAY